MSALTAKDELLQHLETDVSASQCTKHPVSGNIAKSSLCHRHTALARPPPASPASASAQAKSTYRCDLVVFQRRGWLRSALLPSPDIGSKLRQTFIKKGYLQIKHHLPSREKNKVQTKRNQLICAEQGGKATQPLSFVLPLPGCALERCYTVTHYRFTSPSLEHLSSANSLGSHSPASGGWYPVGSRICSCQESFQQPPLQHLGWRVTAEGAGGGQVWVMVYLGRGLTLCVVLGRGHERRLMEKVSPPIQLRPRSLLSARSEQLQRCGCLLSTAPSLSCFFCVVQPGRQPSSSEKAEKVCQQLSALLITPPDPCK